MHEHGFLHQSWCRRPAAAVDVETIGIDADRHNFCSQLVEDLRRHAVGGTVGAIDHDLQAVEAQVFRKAAFDELDIPAECIVQAAISAS